MSHVTPGFDSSTWGGALCVTMFSYPENGFLRTGQSPAIDIHCVRPVDTSHEGSSGLLRTLRCPQSPVWN